MKKTFKKLLASTLAIVMTMVLATTSFAAKTSNTKTKATSEFGTLTGNVINSGEFYGRKEVLFDTQISKLSSTCKKCPAIDLLL